MIFLFNLGVFSGSMLIFRGVSRKIQGFFNRIYAQTISRFHPIQGRFFGGEETFQMIRLFRL